MRFIYLLILINSCGTQSIGCISKPKPITDKYLDECKWYFYSFGLLQKYTCQDNSNISLLNTTLLLIRIDTISENEKKYYFIPYIGSDTITCNGMPFKIAGVRVLNGKYYSPLIHSVETEFDNVLDSIKILMNRSEKRLLDSLKVKNYEVDSWLKKYTRR